MQNLFQSLLTAIGRATNPELAKQVEALVQQNQFLKTENQVLRGRLPERIIATPEERRRLMKFGAPLGNAIKELITIVAATTFFRWLREEKSGKKPGTPGRRKRIDVRALIVTLAQATSWGYTRILGELRKLTSQKISRQFVINVMKEHGFDPGPKRGEKTWSEFLEMHAHSMWQCDFVTKKVCTLLGVREFFLIAFLHIGTRKVFDTPATDHPTAEWVAEQAQAFRRHLNETGLKAEYLYHDRDGKYGKAFDAPLEAHGIEVRRIPIRAPNMQAFVERWIQSLQTECLDHFVPLGKKHLDYLVKTYVGYYMSQRPHQGIGNVRLAEGTAPPDDVPAPGDLRCEVQLGGLLKSFHRNAA